MELHPGERLNFLLVPGPEKARAWELIEGEIPYDRPAYTELMLRAIDSVVAPLGVDRHTLETWLLGNAGYWGPPGVLPPAGVDIAAPLLAAAGYGRGWASAPRPQSTWTAGAANPRPGDCCWLHESTNEKSEDR